LSSVHLVGYSSGGALAGYVLQMSGKQDIELINAMVMLIINVALNFWLIPIYGILGAAMATGASYAVINIARITEVYKLLCLHPYDSNYYKLFIAGFVVIFLSGFLFVFNVSRLSWILSVIILVIVYFAVLYFLGLEYEDKMIWETIKKRISN
jgi:O-antigen/teichoic acid export membrane protein